MSMITVCQICWKLTSHKTNPTLTPYDKIKKDKSDKQICTVCNQNWSPVQLVKSNGKWVYIRPRPANIPGEFKMCDKKGKCLRGAACTFAHSREELELWNKEREGPPMPDKPRPAPPISGNRYMMCTHHSNGKRCLYGADCKFAHSQEELDAWNATVAHRIRAVSGEGMSSRGNSICLDDTQTSNSNTHHISSSNPLSSNITYSNSSSNSNNHINNVTSLSSGGGGSSSGTGGAASTPPGSTSSGTGKTSSSSIEKKYSESDNKHRIIPGLHNVKTVSSSNRVRLSSMSSNTSSTSEKQLPVSLTHSATSRYQTSASATGEITYRCETCDCTCTSKKQLKEHIAGAKHKQIARSNSLPDQPVIRERPSGGFKEYRLCKSVEESGRCIFGTGCPEAHSYEELEKWNNQAHFTGNGSEMSFLEKVRQELDSLNLQIHELLQPKNGIVIEEVTGTALQLNHVTDRPVTWIFRITVRKSCQLAGAIMLGEQYPQFKFVSLNIGNAALQPTSSVYAIECNQLLNPSDSFTVQVQFTPQTGCFPQVIVFKFNGFFIGKLVKVVSMSQDVLELHKHCQQLVNEQSKISYSNWKDVIKTVPLPSSTLQERDQCPTEYPLNPSVLNTTLSPHLTMNNYKKQLHTLLYIEELERDKMLDSSFLPNMACTVMPGYKDEYMFHCAPEGYVYITFSTENITHHSAHLIDRNRVCEVRPGNSTVVYQGILEVFSREELVVRVSEEATKACDGTASVRFTQRRKWFRYMHYALDHVDPNILFPRYSPAGRSTRLEEFKLLLDQTNLNAAQRGVIEDIIDPYTSHVPTLVSGPFGTGKTSTLVEAVMILLQVNSMAKILVCTHSNSAADIYIERLDKKFGSEFLKGRILRHYYYRKNQDAISPVLRQYTHMVNGNFEIPPREELDNIAVIVTTIEQSGDLAFCDLESGYFTHIFIDEAAQIMECQSLIPLQLATYNPNPGSGKCTKIVLAGDHMQLEEELLSLKAKEYGLQRSLLERLISSPLYKTDEASQCSTSLIHNYRTHPIILNLPSELFYENKLIPMVPDTTETLPHPPLSFYGIQGEEMKDKNSLSFGNLIEATEVKNKIVLLREKGMEESEMCVLTPYTRQCQIIRHLLRKERLKNVTVMVTNGIQGREYRALIVSTVRTCRSESDNPNDEESSFINNPKLFNMAITRAKDILVIVGEPYTLCTTGPNRTCWHRLIQYCLSLKTFHFPNTNDFISYLNQPIISKFPTNLSPPKEEPLSDYTETERKQFFRQKLLPLVQKYCPDYAVKVTTVLVEMNTQKMIELFASDSNELQNKIKSTLDFLGMEETSSNSVPKYFLKQIRGANEHEQVLYLTSQQLQQQQPQNITALRLLQEQFNILKEQKLCLSNQCKLFQQFNAALTLGNMNNGPLSTPSSTPRTNGPFNTSPIFGPSLPSTSIQSGSSILSPSNTTNNSSLSIGTPINNASSLPFSGTFNNISNNSGFSSSNNGPPPGWGSSIRSGPSAFSLVSNNNHIPDNSRSTIFDNIGSSVIGAPLYNSNSSSVFSNNSSSILGGGLPSSSLLINNSSPSESLLNTGGSITGVDGDLGLSGTTTPSRSLGVIGDTSHLH